MRIRKKEKGTQTENWWRSTFYFIHFNRNMDFLEEILYFLFSALNVYPLPSYIHIPSQLTLDTWLTLHFYLFWNNNCYFSLCWFFVIFLSSTRIFMNILILEKVETLEDRDFKWRAVNKNMGSREGENWCSWKNMKNFFRISWGFRHFSEIHINTEII